MCMSPSSNVRLLLSRAGKVSLAEPFPSLSLRNGRSAYETPDARARKSPSPTASMFVSLSRNDSGDTRTTRQEYGVHEASVRSEKTLRTNYPCTVQYGVHTYSTYIQVSGTTVDVGGKCLSRGP